jgi:hypothetical protein
VKSEQIKPPKSLIPDFAFKKRKKLDPLKSSHQSSPEEPVKLAFPKGCFGEKILTDLFKNNSDHD